MGKSAKTHILIVCDTIDTHESQEVVNLRGRKRP